MKTVCCAGIAAVLLAAVALTDAREASAQTATPASYRVGSIIVETPWSREAPGGVKRAVGYMRLTNTGQQADRLVGGTAAGPGHLEVHQSVSANGFAHMQAVAEGLVIGPGETVELKPGGLHVMLLDLRQGPKAGEIIKGTLVFERAGTVDIEYQVGGVGSPSAPTAAAGHHHH